MGGSTLATEAKTKPPVGKMLLRFPGLSRAPHPAAGWVHTHTRWIKARTAFLDLISILPHLATPTPSISKVKQTKKSNKSKQIFPYLLANA